MNNTKVKCFARRIAGFFFLLSVFVAATAMAQDVPPNFLQAMQWRLIGPHRGGRVTSVSGVPSQPAIYYIGTPGGGVWKTENGGQVWTADIRSGTRRLDWRGRGRALRSKNRLRRNR